MNVGIVGDGVTDFKIGDRVASNGNHAEVVCVPKNLVAQPFGKLPPTDRPGTDSHRARLARHRFQGHHL